MNGIMLEDIHMFPSLNFCIDNDNQFSQYKNRERQVYVVPTFCTYSVFTQFLKISQKIIFMSFLNHLFYSRKLCVCTFYLLKIINVNRLYRYLPMFLMGNKEFSRFKNTITTKFFQFKMLIGNVTVKHLSLIIISLNIIYLFRYIPMCYVQLLSIYLIYCLKPIIQASTPL